MSGFDEEKPGAGGFDGGASLGAFGAGGARADAQEAAFSQYRRNAVQIARSVMDNANGRYDELAGRRRENRAKVYGGALALFHAEDALFRAGGDREAQARAEFALHVAKRNLVAVWSDVKGLGGARPEFLPDADGRIVGLRFVDADGNEVSKLDLGLRARGYLDRHGFTEAARGGRLDDLGAALSGAGGTASPTKWRLGDEGGTRADLEEGIKGLPAREKAYWINRYRGLFNDDADANAYLSLFEAPPAATDAAGTSATGSAAAAPAPELETAMDGVDVPTPQKRGEQSGDERDDGGDNGRSESELVSRELKNASTLERTQYWIANNSRVDPESEAVTIRAPEGTENRGMNEYLESLGGKRTKHPLFGEFYVFSPEEWRKANARLRHDSQAERSEKPNSTIGGGSSPSEPPSGEPSPAPTNSASPGGTDASGAPQEPEEPESPEAPENPESSEPPAESAPEPEEDWKKSGRWVPVGHDASAAPGGYDPEREQGVFRTDRNGEKYRLVSKGQGAGSAKPSERTGVFVGGSKWTGGSTLTPAQKAEQETRRNDARRSAQAARISDETEREYLSGRDRGADATLADARKRVEKLSPEARVRVAEAMLDGRAGNVTVDPRLTGKDATGEDRREVAFAKQEWDFYKRLRPLWDSLSDEERENLVEYGGRDAKGNFKNQRTFLMRQAPFVQDWLVEHGMSAFDPKSPLNRAERLNGTPDRASELEWRKRLLSHLGQTPDDAPGRQDSGRLHDPLRAKDARWEQMFRLAGADRREYEEYMLGDRVAVTRDWNPRAGHGRGVEPKTTKTPALTGVDAEEVRVRVSRRPKTTA